MSPEKKNLTLARQKCKKSRFNSQRGARIPRRVSAPLVTGTLSDRISEPVNDVSATLSLPLGFFFFSYNFSFFQPHSTFVRFFARTMNRTFLSLGAVSVPSTGADGTRQGESPFQSPERVNWKKKNPKKHGVQKSLGYKKISIEKVNCAWIPVVCPQEGEEAGRGDFCTDRLYIVPVYIFLFAECSLGRWKF